MQGGAATAAGDHIDEQRPLLQQSRANMPPRPFRTRLLHLLLCTVAIAVMGLVAVAVIFAPDSNRHGHRDRDHRHPHKPGPVELTAFVMSKCPDAAFCEPHINLVLERVGSIVDLTTQYIADPDSDGLYGASCKHGDSECLGNIVQLCARDSFPDRAKWYNFVLCLSEEWFAIPDEDKAKTCAKEAGGFDYELLRPCIEGQRGIELLKQSIERVKAAGAKKSCSIYLNGNLRCIRDGGEWYDCPEGSSVDELIHSVCKLYRPTIGEQLPAACHSIVKRG